MIAFGWARAMGLGRALDGLRHAAAPVRGHLPPAVLDVLPDAAWALALAGIVRFSWALEPGRARRAWLAIGFVLAVGWELAQGLHLVRGTFDPRDLLVSAIAYALAASMPFSQSREASIEMKPSSKEPSS